MMTTSEILAGALALFQTGPRGRRLRRPRWSTGMAYNKHTDTYCALGALSQVATGRANASAYYWRGSLRSAAQLVAKHIPRRYKLCTDDPSQVISWNDELPRRTGFKQVKQVFCKALQESLAIERKRQK